MHKNHAFLLFIAIINTLALLTTFNTGKILNYWDISNFTS